MKFKLLSLAMLLICFVFLGVLAGVIPVAEPDAASVFGRTADTPTLDEPTRSPAPDVVAASPQALAPPTPRLAGTAAPVSTDVIAGPTAAPTARPTPSERPAAAVAPVSPTRQPRLDTAETSAAPTSAPEPTAAPTPIPTATPAPTAAPAAIGWEPDVAVISTTITWNDPLQNDTDLEIDGQALLDQEPDIVLPAQGPQILIIHTHGTEAYTPAGEDQYQATAEYRTTDPDHTVIKVGQALGEALESYGLNVLVDTELYDWPSYNGSYSRAEEAIKGYLSRDPDIAMIIDLHRDALGDDETVYRTVSDKLDAPAAQMMFVVGTDENMTHPNWRENLALAVSLQGLVEAEYPHLMRPTLVCPYRYNQQFTTGSVLLEIGTSGNTLAEAITAAELFADAVGPVLAARVDA